MSKTILESMEVTRPFGGQYVPESLVESLENVQAAFEDCWNDISFQQEFYAHLDSMRPLTRLYFANKLSKVVGGAKIYFKREDLNLTGSHCLVNALGQALLARRLNRTTILAETGSGAHGIATAAVCQRLGLKCEVYMGTRDARARPDQVKKIRAYGAILIEVNSGEGTVREAVTAVLRAAVEQYEIAYPLLGGPYGPRPIPMIACAFQATIGIETRKQMLSRTGNLPRAVVACAGIHSSSVGMFDPFLEDQNVRLIAVEAAGPGTHTALHAAVLSNGSLGVYHGAHTMVLQDVHGQINQVQSIAPDLCYPSVSPWLARWVHEGRIEPVAVTDDEAFLACAILSRTQGIHCSLEDGHALVAGIEAASKMSRNESVVICLGG